MGNGALPNGPSYRAHPRLYHPRHAVIANSGQLTKQERPKRAWAFNDRGFAYYLKGNPDSAFADFEQVIFAWVFPYSDLSRGLKIPCFPDSFRDTADVAAHDNFRKNGGKPVRGWA